MSLSPGSRELVATSIKGFQPWGQEVRPTRAFGHRTYQRLMGGSMVRRANLVELLEAKGTDRKSGAEKKSNGV